MIGWRKEHNWDSIRDNPMVRTSLNYKFAELDDRVEIVRRAAIDDNSTNGQLWRQQLDKHYYKIIDHLLPNPKAK